MPTVTLDANTVRTATCPSGQKKLDLYDTTIPGFVLEVRPSGGKTWYLRARVILGESPAEEKKALRAIPTLEDFAKRYLNFAKGAKRSWDTDESFLRNHVLPRWAKRHLDEVRQQYIVPLLLLLGCRKRELLDSQWSHFDLERRTWRIPLSKNGKARHVPLSADVLAILAQVPRWDDCPFVLPNPKTKKPYVSFFYSWDTARKQAGLPEVRVHDLRHSTASFLVNSGRSLYEVQKILGHTQLKTTQRYAHLSQATLLEAVDSLAGVSGLSLATV